MASSPSGEFSSSTLVIFVADLAGFAIAFRTRPDPEMAHFLDKYYSIAEDVIRGASGRIVKFMGDSVLAVFPHSDAPNAVAAAVALETAVRLVAHETGIPVTLGVNVHMGPAVEAELGRGPSRRSDVVGRAVNQAFLLGRGPGIRISEPVYRKLASGERSPWSKNKPPVVYVLGEGGQPYAGLGKTAAQNAARW
jgi:class 3 adenylate cyclase